MSDKVTIGTAVLDRLHRLGVRHIFGIPGDYVLSLYQLIESSPIKHIGTTREDCAELADRRADAAERYAALVRGQLGLVGEDPAREGLLRTPQRVADAIGAARRSFDFIVVDTHPSYGSLNMAIFDRADRILLPVTPDLPALRAAVQLRDVAAELGIRDRISMVVNRANSGVSVSDMERTVGIPALALIRSGGLLFVRAANEGRTVIDRFPKEKVSADFDLLADRLLPITRATAGETKPAVKSLFGRKELAARA